MLSRASVIMQRGMRGFSSKAAVVRCASNYSIEVTPMGAKKIPSFTEIEGLHHGTAVNVTFLVGSDIEDTIGICKRLHDDKLAPVAHVPARSFRSLKDVEGYFDRLVDVGVKEVLVLGGGGPSPVGELTEAMQILESGLLQKYNFERIGVAAHPEGHPDVAEDGPNGMQEALLKKAEWANANGIDMYYETQFCFEPAPIVEWEKKTRALIVKRIGSSGKVPTVRLGVAGPAKIKNLIKFATMSGVGNSIRFVTKYAMNVTKLLTTSTPDGLLYGIAAHQAEDPECMITGMHYYTFGGLMPTLRWANGAADGQFEMRPDGFQVKGF